MEAMQQRDHANLEQSIEAERMVEDAKAAEQAALRAEKQKAHAKGEGRATALRTVWTAKMTDKREAAKWAMNNYTDDFVAFIQDKADKAVRSGSRSIPGFNVSQEKVL
jgi:hypothetical protein